MYCRSIGRHPIFVVADQHVAVSRMIRPERDDGAALEEHVGRKLFQAVADHQVFEVRA
jgi:hypothetical protein